MKHKLLLFSILLLFGFAGLKAQTKLYVSQKSGTQTVFTASDLRKLTFDGGKMVVNKTDGSGSDYSLGDIRYLCFNDYITGVPQSVASQSSKLSVYPNPVADQLQIEYQTAKAGNTQIEILDLQGKLLLQQALGSTAGTNHDQITVTKLAKGIYLCRVNNGKSIETIKFLKQ